MTTNTLTRGQRLELDITDVAFGGDGLGRSNGFVVFVPFVLVGERVELRITDVKRSYASAELVRVVREAQGRVAPRCDYYAHCAGCQYQHIDYALQPELKRKQVIDILQRIGKFAEPPVAPAVASPRPFHYRNKIVLHGPGRPAFHALKRQALVPVRHCPIASEPVNDALAKIADQALGDEHLTLRSDSDGRVRSWKQARGTRKPSEPEFAAARSDEANGMIKETLLGKTLEVPPGVFFQVNRDMIALAVAHAREVFAASGCTTLVDAYCGIGLFALLLADLAGQVHGMEVDGRAIAAARHNASRLGLNHCSFSTGTTEELLSPTLRRCKLREVCLVLDPPRSGCGTQVLNILRRQRPAKLIYVSCSPPTLARDVRLLVDNGYRLERVTPFDMFPQTAHCEAVAELSAIGKGKPARK